MKRSRIILGVALLAVAAGLFGYFNQASSITATKGESSGDDLRVSVPSFMASTKVAELEAELAKYKSKEEEDEKLGQYAINMMFATAGGKKLSDAKKQILARAIVRVSNDIFQTPDNKRAFVAVLAIESQFDRFAQSPTGPKGLAQLAKATFKESMADCGVTSLNEEDVWETDLNLYAGACYFKKLLNATNGDPYFAIVAYNQGPNSESAKMFAKSGYLTELEPLKYVARFTFLQRQVTDQKTVDIPAIQDLPKPVSPKNHKGK
jgi:membrane-bound lytic murein transglycosylase MltF